MIVCKLIWQHNNICFYVAKYNKNTVISMICML
nr:MAG TPA: hypothetical protein [Caudoviricetes sp.]